jgi:hypothetical protein
MTFRTNNQQILTCVISQKVGLDASRGYVHLQDPTAERIGSVCSTCLVVRLIYCLFDSIDGKERLSHNFDALDRCEGDYKI